MTMQRRPAPTLLLKTYSTPRLPVPPERFRANNRRAAPGLTIVREDRAEALAVLPLPLLVRLLRGVYEEADGV